MNFKECYAKTMAENGCEEFATDCFAEKFEALTDTLLEVNKHMNLTALKTPEDIILKHYVDSVKVVRHIPQSAKLIDVGTGAGFPSLPLAIVRNDVRIVALDSTAKKLEFVASAAEKLGLDNISTLNLRAEDAAKTEIRERYDVVCARAVAKLNVLSELCLPLVSVGGCFLALKGASATDEIEEAKKSVEILGGKISENDSFELVSPTERQKRSIIIIQKISKTPPIYPRNFAQINKKPL